MLLSAHSGRQATSNLHSTARALLKDCQIPLHPPPKEISVKKINFNVVKKSRLFERSEFLDFRQKNLIFRKLLVVAAFFGLTFFLLLKKR
jgi:hypothetical protein